MSEERVDALRSEGYSNVYVWKAKPNEEDLDHVHPFDTHLEILEGEIEIGIGNKKTVVGAGDTVDIPRNTVHNGKVGSQGCAYIVAERQ